MDSFPAVPISTVSSQAPFACDTTEDLGPVLKVSSVYAEAQSLPHEPDTGAEVGQETSCRDALAAPAFLNARHCFKAGAHQHFAVFKVLPTPVKGCVLPPSTSFYLGAASASFTPLQYKTVYARGVALPHAVGAILMGYPIPLPSPNAWNGMHMHGWQGWHSVCSMSTSSFYIPRILATAKRTTERTGTLQNARSMQRVGDRLSAEMLAALAAMPEQPAAVTNAAPQSTAIAADCVVIGDIHACILEALHAAESTVSHPADAGDDDALPAGSASPALHALPMPWGCHTHTSPYVSDAGASVAVPATPLSTADPVERLHCQQAGHSTVHMPEYGSAGRTAAPMQIAAPWRQWWSRSNGSRAQSQSGDSHCGTPMSDERSFTSCGDINSSSNNAIFVVGGSSGGGAISNCGTGSFSSRGSGYLLSSMLSSFTSRLSVRGESGRSRKGHGSFGGQGQHTRESTSYSNFPEECSQLPAAHYHFSPASLGSGKLGSPSRAQACLAGRDMTGRACGVRRSSQSASNGGGAVIGGMPSQTTFSRRSRFAPDGRSGYCRASLDGDSGWGPARGNSFTSPSTPAFDYAGALLEPSSVMEQVDASAGLAACRPRCRLLLSGNTQPAACVATADATAFHAGGVGKEAQMSAYGQWARVAQGSGVEAAEQPRPPRSRRGATGSSQHSTVHRRCEPGRLIRILASLSGCVYFVSVKEDCLPKGLEALGPGR